MKSARYGQSTTALTPIPRANYLTSSTETLEVRVLKVIRKKGQRGIRSKKIWEDRTINESWDEVEYILDKLIKENRIIVSNKRFWLKLT